MVEPLSFDDQQEETTKKPAKPTKAQKNKKSVVEEEQLPELLNPFAMTLSYEQSVEAEAGPPSFRRQERELFEMAMVLSGWVSKKTKTLFSRWQKKYFQVIANGAYLAYYDKQPDRLRKDVLVPNGVFLIHEVIDI